MSDELQQLLDAIATRISDVYDEDDRVMDNADSLAIDAFVAIREQGYAIVRVL